MKWQRKLDIALIIFSLLALSLVLFAQTAFYFDFDNGLVAKRSEEYFTAELPTVREEYALFGNLELESAGGISLSKAVILINGQESGDFKDGDVLVRVYEDDVVTIDTSAYAREIEFGVSNYSRNIDIDKLNPTLISDNGKVDVGIISFK